MNAIDERVGRESPKYDRVWSADARASQHRNGQLRSHAHVDGDTITFLYTQRLHHIGEFLHLAMKLLVGEGPDFTGFAFPDDGGFIFA